MVEVDCRTARPGGVTLVAVRLDNRVEAPGVDAHRIRLASRLDGPVWPPRVEGVPAGPWDCDGSEAAVEVVVPTGRVGSVGFASPAPPVAPPVEVETVEPADGESTDGAAPSPADVLRVLGDPSPPRDAVDVATAESAVEAPQESDDARSASDRQRGGGR